MVGNLWKPLTNGDKSIYIIETGGSFHIFDLENDQNSTDFGSLPSYPGEFYPKEMISIPWDPAFSGEIPHDVDLLMTNAAQTYNFCRAVQQFLQLRTNHKFGDTIIFPVPPVLLVNMNFCGCHPLSSTHNDPDDIGHCFLSNASPIVTVSILVGGMVVVQ